MAWAGRTLWSGLASPHFAAALSARLGQSLRTPTAATGGPLDVRVKPAAGDAVSPQQRGPSERGEGGGGRGEALHVPLQGTGWMMPG